MPVGYSDKRIHADKWSFAPLRRLSNVPLQLLRKARKQSASASYFFRRTERGEVGLTLVLFIHDRD